MSTRQQPLSPHLTIYRFTVVMAMSIIHRITGVALYAGTLLLVAWLAAAAIGGPALQWVSWLLGTWLGQIVLFGYTWVLFHHMYSGLRYLVWDFAIGHEKASRETMSIIAAIAGFASAVLVWLIYFRA